jgi:hypothetical protein
MSIFKRNPKSTDPTQSYGLTLSHQILGLVTTAMKSAVVKIFIVIWSGIQLVLVLLRSASTFSILCWNGVRCNFNRLAFSLHTFLLVMNHPSICLHRVLLSSKYLSVFPIIFSYRGYLKSYFHGIPHAAVYIFPLSCTKPWMWFPRFSRDLSWIYCEHYRDLSVHLPNDFLLFCMTQRSDTSRHVIIVLVSWS